MPRCKLQILDSYTGELEEVDAELNSFTGSGIVDYFKQVAIKEGLPETYKLRSFSKNKGNTVISFIVEATSKESDTEFPESVDDCLESCLEELLELPSYLICGFIYQ